MDGADQWKQVTDDYGNVYYYNMLTHESTWEIPEPDEDDANAAVGSGSDADDSSSSSSSSSEDNSSNSEAQATSSDEEAGVARPAAPVEEWLGVSTLGGMLSCTCMDNY